MVRIVHAGNTEAPSLAILRRYGYEVEARNEEVVARSQVRGVAVELMAEDCVALLGLAVMFAERGENWYPTDAEVEDLLALDGCK